MLKATTTFSLIDTRMMSVVGLAAAMLLLAERPATAQPEIFPSDVPWTVQPQFGLDAAARNSISGTTCNSNEAGLRRNCLVVFEDAKYAQFFRIDAQTIRPGATINLVPDSPNLGRFRSLGAEAAGFDHGFFYVVNSRAARILPPLTGETFDPSFLVSRFAVDARGLPVFPLPGIPVPPNIQVSKKLQEAIAAGIPTGGFPGQVLDATRAEVEGLAVKDGIMYFGFRGPQIGGKSLILSASVQSMFGIAPLNAAHHFVTLGSRLGIRDMARVTDGILILAGPVADAGGGAALFRWNEVTNELRDLGVLVDPTNRKAESLIVLDEDPEFYNILVMYDDIANGGPTQYNIPL